MIVNDYDYDLINHPYLSEVVDANDVPTSQSFTIPAGAKHIFGFRIKASRYGHPGPILYRIGSSIGASDVAEGSISPDDVLPVFELMVGDDFEPVAVEQGQTYYLQLSVSRGTKPLDAYRLYGPNTRSDTGDPGNTLIPYWWSEEYEVDDEMDIPIPRDYRGARYPHFESGARHHDDGTVTWNLSFAILTDEDDGYPARGEQRFEFVRQLTAAPFREWKYLRDDSIHPGKNELLLGGNWGIRVPAATDPILENAIAEIEAFLDTVMGVTLMEGKQEKNVVIEVAEDSEIPSGDESFTIFVRKDGIRVCARHAKGILRAVHWMEDQFLVRRAPILNTGVYRVQPKYGLRMVPGIYPAPSYFQLQEEQIWTRGYVWRLARAGYNAIYFQANLEELVEDSAFFPEMNDDNAVVAIERLRRMTDLASQFGVDVYFDLKTGYFKKFSQAAYERVPEIRTFQKWGDHPCGGQQIVLDFYKETISNLFSQVDKLKGMVVIYDTEGFYSCFLHNKKNQCPYCKDYPIEELSSRLFETLREAVRVGGEDTELILWSYFCDESWNYQVIRSMPPDATLMACFSQFRELNRFGVRVRTDDYSICSDQPSAYFRKIKGLANENGMRFLCKTEDTFGQEFVSTPYTPCLEQHQRRWDSVSQQEVDGFLAQYIHHGYTPGPCADLTRQNVFNVEKDGHALELTAEEKLKNAALMQYGPAAADSVVKAWNEFSIAIRDYFPYTWGVCRYPGPLQSAPAQPFYLDPERKMPRPRSRGYVNDLRWTGIDGRFLVDPSQNWNADLVSRCFQGFRRHYRKGIDQLQAALVVCDEAYKAALIGELRVARTQYLQVTSLINFIQFIRLRDEYLRDKPAHLLSALIYVCENELENATQALEIAIHDSRIGFSCEGAGTVRGGLFTPLAIEQKIDSLQETLRDLYTRLERVRA